MLKNTWKRYLDDQSGATAVEYVVIASALTLALIPGFYYVTSAFQTQMEDLISAINS
ncbi:Flp family type IVb pilin [Aestuariivirga sp.]|uniref:Flp family type IVb pilin n=1 Tax=Aestuariivirga sp. TaxID=2650926 RepID=UPI0039E6E68E